MKNILLVVMSSFLLISTVSIASVDKQHDAESKFLLKNEFLVANDVAFQLGGSMMLDYNHTRLNEIAKEDKLNLRYGRIYAMGGDENGWSFKAQFVLGNGESGRPKDVYITYGGWGEVAKLTVGKQKVEFGLEEITSLNNNTTLERSAITKQYAVGHQKAIKVHGALSNTVYSLLVFEDNHKNINNIGYSGRVIYLPIKNDDMLVHVGVGYVQRSSEYQVKGLELAANVGPFHIQSEYFEEEQLDAAGLDATGNGYYIQAGYILTGETRLYSQGRFGRIKPSNSNGAWEIFARIEAGDGNYSNIELGQVDALAYTVGANWYVANHIKLGMNYSGGNSNEAGSHDQGKEFRVRLQLTY